MSHLIILPILLPLCAGCLLLLGRRGGVPAARGLALLSCLAQLVVAGLLLDQADSGDIGVYTLGNWQPPAGIVLVLDRLAALLLFTTAVLALAALGYACTGADRGGRHFHALFQFQLFGINGAFLTGDLFNLFVFFEILLIASYGLLLHGRGAARVRAGLHYVVLNLTGSALFLIAVGVLYGVTGTLNLADLSVYMAVADPADAPLLAAAGLLLLLVFGLKAALFPLHFWLPRAYAAASAPVAALFAIMTKVGVYAILRVTGLLFGARAGALAELAQPWLWPLALLTVALGAAGALAARTLQGLAAYLVVISAGTLLLGVALNSAAATTALLYYLLHSTWAGAALFLLAGLIASQRGDAGGRLEAGPPLRHARLLGTLFFIAAVAQAGLPPLAGFVGKLLLLQAVPMAQAGWVWGVVLGGTLVTLVALTRAGSTVFWQADGERAAAVALPRAAVAATALLLAATLVLSVAGGPIVASLQLTAAQLADPQHYAAAVLSRAAGPAGVAP